jgi:hypothetical protein
MGSNSSHTGEVRSAIPLLAKCFFHFPLPLPFFPFPERQRPLPYVFLKKQNSNRTAPTPTLTPISRYHQPISGLGPSVDIELLSTRCLKKKTSTVPCSRRSGLGRKPEWDSNTLISLNRELPLSATTIGPPKAQPHPRKVQAASKPFSVCRSYMNMITLTPPTH